MEYDAPFEPDQEREDPPGTEPEPTEDDGALRRTRSGLSPVLLAVLLVVLLLFAAGAYWWLVLRQPPKPDLPTGGAGAPAASPAVPAPDGKTPAATEADPVELPPLSRSDAFVRDVAVRLSDHPALVRWLAHEDLVRRFVAGVANVAEGKSPRSHVQFLAPEEPFRVRRADGELVAHPRAYGRYDLAVDVFTSVDIGAAVELYHEMEPLFDAAYAEIGEPGTTFRGTFARALERLLAVEIPTRPPELEEAVISYRYADPAMESLDPASKHLLRLGPERAARVQTKLRFLQAGLDLEQPEG